MTGSIRIFEKLNFTPKSSVFCFSQGQTSKYDRLAQMLVKARSLVQKEFDNKCEHLFSVLGKMKDYIRKL